MPSIVATDSRLNSNTRNIGSTFTSYTAQTDDLIVIFAAVPSDTGTPSIGTVSGWTGIAQVSNSLGSLTGLMHPVTSAEAAANTTSFTATNYFNVAKNSRTVACVVRGGDPASYLDAFSTVASASSSTHQFPALVGTDLSSGSLLIGVVTAGTGDRTYTDSPAGYSLAIQADTGTAVGMWVRAAASVAGVNVAAQTVTPTSASSYRGMSVAITAAPAADQGRFFALF
ncbi:hypothetical protein [Mycolicibacterium bacteremicum]|uniref:Uncharacterized protein n=1 Tax=Mycolicibacterium bacteremicum TaxID=564198 RepID=A0A1W9Z0E8_MYCBA|nr:hypothetical protein [Mycolicibacterium bacteremicum]MCV7434801.1 hypothetical protein [Mycolicibacterium bacteremicum]ORA05791.1 hypothetical protein BST17_08525 [Mycolicibacterium bacteremicum]